MRVTRKRFILCVKRNWAISTSWPWHFKFNRLWA